jgi:hypothetical protein
MKEESFEKRVIFSKIVVQKIDLRRLKDNCLIEGEK